MKKIFALRGPRNLGKSQTIRTVVEMLTEKHPDAIFEHNHKTKVDVRAVLTINGSKIGIESQGDPNGRLIKESLDLFLKIGCDVIICATRTSGGTKDAVDALQLQGFDVNWLEQSRRSQPFEQVLRDLATAREISEKVDALIETERVPVRSLSATA